jgi:MFS family permease
VTPLLLPVIGWRGMFAVGLLPAVVAFLIRRLLDEPAIFITRRARRHENSFRLLVIDRRPTRISIGIAVLCSVQNLGYYSVMTWMPTYLAANLGFTLTKSALWTSVTVLGMVVGMWTFGQLADRVGRKPMFILFQAGAAIMVFVYSRLTGPTALLWTGAIMGVFVNGMFGGYGALISEAYPTAARATAQNLLFNFGRGVGALGPLLIGSLAATFSFSAAIGLLASLYLLDILATVFLIPELKGERLR